MHMYILEEGSPEFVTIKGGLIEGLNWTGGTHLFCRSAVVPIPEGVRRFEAEPVDWPVATSTSERNKGEPAESSRLQRAGTPG